MWRLLRSFPFTVYALFTGALWWVVLRSGPDAVHSGLGAAALILAQVLVAPFALAGYLVGVVVWAMLHAAFGSVEMVSHVSGFAVVLALAQAADAAVRWWRGPEPDPEVVRFPWGLHRDGS